MTNKQHPIIPSTKLVELWRADASNVPATHSTDPGGRRDYIDFIATAAAQWGADQELEACCEWIPKMTPWDAEKLRAARRPKPPSLKEQAYAALDTYIYGEPDPKDKERTYNTIRQALEQLND